MTPSQPVTGENGAAQTLPGDPARLVTLSRSTEAVISKRGVMLVRGSHAWRLGAAEARALGRALSRTFDSRP